MSTRGAIEAESPKKLIKVKKLVSLVTSFQFNIHLPQITCSMIHKLVFVHIKGHTWLHLG